DLVRIGVADAGEEMRIGERALDRMVLAPQARGDLGHLDVEDLDAARIQSFERREEVQRSAALGAGFGEGEHAGLELEERERIGWLLAGLTPAQAPGDHEVER